MIRKSRSRCNRNRFQSTCASRPGTRLVASPLRPHGSTLRLLDAQGNTVKEVLGSDEMNMSKEQSALAETSKRRELVGQPRKDMIMDG